MAAFRGFPPEAIEFLRELEANNDRDWFKANRARYEDHLRAPAMALGEDLSDLGAPRLFRPWNDTRFRAGPPIKEQVGLALGDEAEADLLLDRRAGAKARVVPGAGRPRDRLRGRGRLLRGALTRRPARGGRSSQSRARS